MKFYIKTKLSENISETPEGFLLCRNIMLTHTGALKYGPTEHPFGDDVGEVIMKREPEDLFSDATLASFEGKDITIQHPEDFVSPENYQELTHGVLLNVRKGKEEIEVEGEKVLPMMGDALIKSKEAIEAVKAGLREVSLGYDAFWELIKDGEGRHSKIVGNHCALVDEGRAGKHCAITDSKKGEQNMFTKEQFEKFKTLFKGKSLDEVMKEKEDEEKKAKDAEEAEKAKKEKEEADKKASDSEKVEALSKDVAELKKSIGDLLEAIKGKKEEESKDEEDSEESEEVVAEDEESEDEDEESEDEGSEEELEEEKAKKEKKTGDAALLSKAEILAPGIKNGKDIKKNALATAYKTADGKKIIDTLTGGKKLSEISGDAETAIFNAASEMMKAKRVKDHAAERVTTIDSFPSLKGTGAKSAEDINKQNAEFYNSKK